MPRLERIQIDRAGAPTADEFNRLQTAIERALEKIAAGSSTATSTTIVVSPTTTASGIGGTFPAVQTMDDGDERLEPPPPVTAQARALFWISTPAPSVPYGVNMGALGSGILKQTVASGIATPAIASSADVAGAITWPAAKDVLISSGTSTAPTGTNAWQYDSGSGNIALMGAIIRTNFNSGGPDFSGNYEGIVESWNTNVWSMESQKGGTGTVRAMKFDAHTASMTLNAATLTLTGTNTNVTASTQVAIYTSIGTAPDILMSATQTDHRASLTVASAAGAAWNGIKFGDSTLTLTGSTHVTNTTGVNMVTMGGGVLISSASALTVDFAATVAITAAPIAAGSAVITNSYGLWLQTLSRFDGNGTHVWELPADATVAGAQTGRIPIKVGGATVYLHYFNG